MYDLVRSNFDYSSEKGEEMSDEFNNKTTYEVVTHYEVVTQQAVSDKSKLAAALLCVFFGTLGVHRFYLGRVGSGLLMLFSTVIGLFATVVFFGFGILSIVGIWAFIDFILILCDNLTDAQGRKLR